MSDTKAETYLTFGGWRPYFNVGEIDVVRTPDTEALLNGEN